MYYTRVKTKKQGVFVKKSKILHKYAEKPPAEIPTALRIEININHLKHGCFVYFILVAAKSCVMQFLSCLTDTLHQNTVDEHTHIFILRF